MLNLTTLIGRDVAVFHREINKDDGSLDVPDSALVKSKLALTSMPPFGASNEPTFCVHPLVHRCDTHRSDEGLYCMLMDRNGQAENLALAAGMGCKACQAPVHCLLHLSCVTAAGHATCTQSQLPG